MVYMECTVKIYQTNGMGATKAFSQAILLQTSPTSPPNPSTKIPGQGTCSLLLSIDYCSNHWVSHTPFNNIGTNSRFLLCNCEKHTHPCFNICLFTVHFAVSILHWYTHYKNMTYLLEPLYPL